MCLQVGNSEDHVLHAGTGPAFVHCVLLELSLLFSWKCFVHFNKHNWMISSPVVRSTQYMYDHQTCTSMLASSSTCVLRPQQISRAHSFWLDNHWSLTFISVRTRGALRARVPPPPSSTFQLCAAPMLHIDKSIVLAVSAGSKLGHPLIKQLRLPLNNHATRLIETNYEPSSFHSLPPMSRPNVVWARD